MTEIQSTDRVFILKAMVAMAAADGDLHDDELATICTVYEKNTGEAISADDINTVSQSRQAQTSSLPEQLAEVQGQLAREVKELILSSAYMVLLADGRVSARERKKLMDVAVALKISDIHRSIIFEDVERALG